MPRPDITKIMCRFAQPASVNGDGCSTIFCQSPSSNRPYVDLIPVLVPPAAVPVDSPSFFNDVYSPASTSSYPSSSSSSPACTPSVNQHRSPRRASSVSLDKLERRYSVPIDRFWTEDQQDLLNTPLELISNLLVEVNIPIIDEGMKKDKEIVGGKITERVMKATLCWSDSKMAKNGFIDIL